MYTPYVRAIAQEALPVGALILMSCSSSAHACREGRDMVSFSPYVLTGGSPALSMATLQGFR